MSNEYRHVELLTGDVRRRRWTTEQKLTIIEQSFEPGETVSSTARRHGVGPNLLYRWRRLLSEGGAAAVDSEGSVVANSEVKKLGDRVRELEHMLGRKTMEVEILRLAFIIEAFGREIVAWTDVPNAGISSSDVCAAMLEAVEKRFDVTRAPHAIEHLGQSLDLHTARDTRLFAQALNLTPCFIPVASRQSNGMSKVFVKALKRDFISISAIPDAETALHRHRRMDRRLQRNPSTFRAQDGLP